MSRETNNQRSQGGAGGIRSRGEPPDFDLEAEHDPERAKRISLMRMRRYGAKERSGDATTQVQRAAAEGGKPLPGDMRAKFEGSTGADLSQVRVHTGEASATAAESVGAKAYTTGQDIHFGAGEYDPSSKQGQHLLAHEVAHTVQQGNSTTSQPQAKLEVSSPGDAHEHEADRAADAMLSGRPASISSVAGAGPLQRKESEASTMQSSASSSPHSEGKESASGNPFERPRKSKNQSRADESAFMFDPPTLTFQGVGEEQVSIRNTSSEPQTVDGWHLAGDSSAFQTSFVGSRSVVVQPGATVTFRIRFLSEKEIPQSAVLVVDSMFGDRPAQLNITGVKRGEKTEQGCSETRISATSPEGRRNSIQSAMSSVAAGWNSILGMQNQGIADVKIAVNKQIPKPTPAWKTVLDGVVGQGLSQLIGSIGLYLGAGWGTSAWHAIESLGLSRHEGQAAAKQIASLTLSMHKHITSSYSNAVMSKAATAAREAIEINKEPTLGMRAAFFDAQTRALSSAYEDAVTTLNNSEGDFAALETDHPGLGFAALEAYRNHLSCHRGNVVELQRSATAGMWMAFLAQQDLGVHDPEGWEHAKPGAAVDRNVYNTTDAHHKLRDLARGVLEVHVIWDYDHMRARPVYAIERANTSGVPDEFKELLIGAPIGHFSMPMIVHGKVKKDTPGGTKANSHLRLSRNEGGAITLGAEKGTESAEMLELLGNGDSFAGARTLLQHVDAVTLTKVE